MTHARDGWPHLMTIRHRARVLSDRETRCWIAKIRRDKRAARMKRLEKARSIRAMTRILRNAQRRGAMPVAHRELHWVVEAAELRHDSGYGDTFAKAKSACAARLLELGYLVVDEKGGAR